MNPLLNKIKSIQINTTSDDGLIAGSLSQGSGIAITISPDEYHRATENALEDSVDETIVELLRQYKESITQLLGSNQPQHGLEQLIDDIEVTGTSKREYAVFDWCGEDDVKLILRDGAIQNMHRTETEDEINGAIREAFQLHRNEMKRIQRLITDTRMSGGVKK